MSAASAGFAKTRSWGRESCLFYCDCMDGAKEKALEILRQRGFEVRMHVSYSGGIRQTPAFYAFW